VKSAEEALDILMKLHIDGAFIDIFLPGLDGFSLVTKIRDIDDYYSLPIIFETKVKNDDPNTYKTYWNIDYLTKPFTVADFRNSASLLIQKAERLRKISLKKEDAIIPFQYDGGLAMIAFSDILYATTSPGRKIVLVTHTYDLIKSDASLISIITKIDNGSFVQCHKAFAVNLLNIERIEYSARNAANIYFKNSPGKTCQLGRKYLATIVEALNSINLS